MFPEICSIGPFTIYSYGVMLAIAVFVCAVLLSKEAPKEGIAPAVIFDFIFWVVVSGIVGARLFFIFLNLSYYWNHPLEIIMISKGGLAWQGGLIAGTLTGIVFIKKKSLPLLKTLDLITPYLALGQSIGRLGCFLQGCCYGRAVSWGIYFPAHGAHLHPTQLYAAFGLLALFFILKRYQPKRKKEGQVFILYLVLASGLRFIIEFFRDDHVVFLMGLSIFQVICLGIMVAAFYANTRLKS